MKIKLIVFSIAFCIGLPTSCAIAKERSHYRRIAELDKSQKEIGLYEKGRGFVFIKTPEIDCRGIKVVDGILYISPEISVGVKWDSGDRPVSVPLFARSGTYGIAMSENLETEQDGVISREEKIYISDREVYEESKPMGCRLKSKVIPMQEPSTLRSAEALSSIQ
jgi:hypothetical protein